MPSDEAGHKIELLGAQNSDLRAEIFRAVVAAGWTLLELRKDAQSLDAVFRDLTRGDEKLDRGAGWKAGDESEPDEDDELEDDEEEEEDEDEDDDDDDETEEDSKRPSVRKA